MPFVERHWNILIKARSKKFQILTNCLVKKGCQKNLNQVFICHIKESEIPYASKYQDATARTLLLSKL